MVMNKQETVQFIQSIFDVGDPGVLRELIAKLKGSPNIKEADVPRLWYGLLPLSKLEAEALEEVAVALGAPPTPIEDVKQAFIDDQTRSTGLIYKSVFSSCKAAELSNGCDVAEFSREAVLNMIHELQMYNRASLRKILSCLKVYAGWRREKELPTAEFWINAPIDIDELDLTAGMKAKCVGSPADLFQILNNRLPLNEGYLAPVAAVLAWSGFTLAEMVEIKQDEVSDDGRLVRGVEIAPELAPILQAYKPLDAVTRERLTVQTFVMENLGYFLKRLSLRPTGKRVDRMGISNAIQAAKIPTVVDLVSSGRYYKLYLMETNGQRVTGEQIADIFRIKRKNDKFGIEDRMFEFMAFKDAFY